MSKTSSHGSETNEWLWHINTCNSDYISWSTSSCVNSFCNAFHSSWYMTNGNLFTWLLYFNFLEANKLRAFNLHHKLTLSLICHAFSTWAFNFWGKFSSIYNLIYFETTNITSINCNLNTWSNIRNSCYNTSASN